ncbi:MAG: membrane protein insertion efficiency factor YidD [Candidatus Eisenbacteria bacterium]
MRAAGFAGRIIAASLAAALPAGPPASLAEGFPSSDGAHVENPGESPEAGRETGDAKGDPSPPISARFVSLMLRSYRATLASQDARRCQFYPSCSHYAETAVRRAGLVRGSLMASSRLQRCHPRAYDYYPLDETRVRFYDPVEGEEGPPTFDPMSMSAPRSRALASSLSALMPGTGQVYAGRPWDGLYSFLQVMIPATFSYLNYERDGSASIRGAGHGFLAVGFYAGGIYGAGRAAADRRINPGGGAFVVNRASTRRSAAEDPETLYDAAQRDRNEGSIARAASRFGAVRLRGGSDLSARAARFEALSLAELGRWPEAEEALRFYAENSEDRRDRAAAWEGLAILEGRERQRSSRARRARVLSALVPGTGQLLSGKTGTAAAALSVNLFLGYYAYRTTRTDSWGEFAVFALPTFWRYYRGNITSAGRLAASRQDRADFEELETRLLAP